jgi:Transmembrane amino acid transporter protein
MSGHAVCSVGFAAIGALISFVCSLPRTFDTLSKLATLSAFFTFISVILAAVFAGIEDHPARYNADPNHINENGVRMGGNPLVLLVPAAGTTFVSGMNAFLNISYTFIGQITLPSFIAEMKNPYDFRKALWLVTIAEIIVFSLVGAGKTSCTPAYSLLTVCSRLRIHRHPVQHCTSFRIPRQRSVQESIFLVHDSYPDLPRRPVCLRLSPFRLLPHLRRHTSQEQPHRHRLGFLGRDSRRHLDRRLHHRRGHSILLRSSVTHEFAV